MLNLLKWNSLDFVHRYFWMILVASASLVLAAVVPDSVGFTNQLLIFSSVMLGGVFFPACIVLALYQCFSWLRHDSALLELSLPVSAWEQILSRVIIAVVVNTLACVGAMALILLLGKYSSGSVTRISPVHFQILAGLNLLLLLKDMTILFSYMISRSIGLTRLWAALVTTFLSTILLILIVVFIVYVMIWTHVLMLPQIGGENFLKLDGNLQITSLIPAIAGCLWIILLEYLGSCLLLKYSFQVD